MIKKIFLLLIFSAAYYSGLMQAYAENNSESQDQIKPVFRFNLSGDVLYKTDKCGAVRIYDKVLAISEGRENGTVYYIRSSGDRWIAGFLKADSGEGVEFKIPWKYDKLYKLAVSDDIFYYLAVPAKEDPEDKTTESPVYVRFNPDQMTSQSVGGVSDFCIIDGKSILIRDNLLDYNGIHIPLTLTGSLKISEIIDSRIALISGNDGTEVVDLIAEKSIYQYKESSVPESPDEYNIILEFEDKIVKTDIPPDAESSIYYEINIDGVEENRTGAGRGELVKIFNAKLSTGSYHVIKAERWELDKVKGRYARMNNVYQPAELKIYIPENRIIKIKMEFGGTGYVINQSVLFK